MFKVGQKIICIEKFEGFMKNLSTHNKWVPHNSIKMPIVGDIYIVTKVWEDGYLSLRGWEIHETFTATKFRPLNYSFAEKVEEMVDKGIVEVEEENLVTV